GLRARQLQDVTRALRAPSWSPDRRYTPNRRSEEHMKRLSASVILTGLLLAQAPSSYRIINRYALGGDGSWDYIVPDPPHHRVFIARQNRVMVVDEDTGKLLGEVTGIQGAHGTAIAESSGHGFATSGNDQSVVMFDLKTFKALGRIPA